MLRKFKYTIGLSILTGLGIIVAQSYWVVSTYQVKQENFVRSASQALGFTVLNITMEKQFNLNKEKSIKDLDNVVFEKRKRSSKKLQDKLEAGAPAGSVLMEVGGSDNSMPIDFIDSLHPPSPTTKTSTIKLALAPSFIQPLQLNIDDPKFRQRLKETLQKNKINIPFVLVIDQQDSTILKKHLITFRTNAVNAHNKILSMDFIGLNTYILRGMVAELLLSVCIIIIASISFILLINTIYRQKQFAEMKNDFISNITHELKTPVSIMMATNEAIVRFNALEDKEKTKRYLAINRDELNKLQGILNNIVTIFKNENIQQVLPRSPFDINVSLQNIVNRFSSLDQVKLHYKNELIDPVFSSNEEAVETIVTNLIDNAIKYNDQLPRQVWIACQVSGTGITISISDNGIGIEKQFLPFVFDKFYRIPKGNLHEVKGFGLGLSHVKQLVEKLKGNIELQSQPGKGSHFIINLPSDEKD